MTVVKLAKALSFPASFFHDSDPEDIDTGAVSFRSFSKMSAKERDAAISAGSLGLQLNNWIEERFGLPKPNLIDLSYETDPDIAAHSLRQYWNLGERPIGNMLGLLETHGVRVFSLSENTASVNAFSFWRDNKPFVFLNNFKTAESSILDTTHELGHLVMHTQARSNDDDLGEWQCLVSGHLCISDIIRCLRW
jgi:IrrE N-terminal-like domain